MALTLPNVTSFQTATGTRELCPDPRWEKCVRNIGDYKARLDSAMVASSRDKISNEENNWLKQEGFEKKSTGTGVNPDTFARLVLGGFYSTSGDLQADKIIHTFPGWCAIGWNRHQYSGLTKQQAELTKALLDQRTMDSTVNDGCARWLSPLAIVVTTEGKNRADLFRSHNLDMLARIETVEYPPASDLELMPVRGTDRIWALRCHNSKYIVRRNNQEHNIALLPLPELSIPLLKAYGVKVGRTFFGLGRLPLPNSEGRNFFRRMQTATWRKTLLEASYV